MFGLPLWQVLLLAYLLIGVAIVFLTSFRTVVLRSLSSQQRKSQPEWKAWVFYFIFFSASIIAYPLFIPGWRKEKQLLNLMGVFEAVAELSADGVDTDEIPGAHGPYGRATTNPIPTKTILGSYSYLARLRTTNGEAVQSNRVGSCNSTVTEMPIDAYRLKTPGGEDLSIVFLSPYHKRTSTMAPDGLRLI